MVLDRGQLGLSKHFHYPAKMFVETPIRVIAEISLERRPMSTAHAICVRERSNRSGHIRHQMVVCKFASLREKAKLWVHASPWYCWPHTIGISKCWINDVKFRKFNADINMDKIKTLLDDM